MDNFDAVSNPIAFVSPWFQTAALYLKSNQLQLKNVNQVLHTPNVHFNEPAYFICRGSHIHEQISPKIM